MRFAAKSISGKITWMNMLVSAAALVLAVSTFFAYDQLTFREGQVHALSAQAQIIASNSVSALVFNDTQSAEATLAALKSSPNIEAAGIFRADQQPFAQYQRTGRWQRMSLPPISDKMREAFWFQNSNLILVEPVVFQGQEIDFVYVRSDLNEIARRLKRYAAIAIVVFVLSLLVALFVSHVFKKSVVEPVVSLAQVARAVSQEKNYSVRAAPSKERDEVAVLITAFNEMLAQIQARDNELQEAHDELEQRVTDRTRELLVSNRELGAFSYSVSHDLRGPVDAVNGFAYVLTKEYASGLDDKGKELINHIRNSGKRMMQLIDDLLNLSRVTSGEMQREAVDLSGIARSITFELRESAPKREVEFVIAEVDAAEGDPRLLRVLLDNLIRNAWKYTSRRPKSKIEFGVERNNGNLIYFVRDDGVGFDARSAERLFQPFQRMHSPDEFPGNGIGLATVQRIVRRHGGEVWAVSEAEKGATFYFYLSKAKGNVHDVQMN